MLKKLFADPGFIAWTAIMVIPFVHMVLDQYVSRMYACLFLAVALSSTFSLWLLCKQYLSIYEFRVQISLLQLLIVMFGVALELGVAIAFVKLTSPNGDAMALFMVLFLIPVLSALCITLAKRPPPPIASASPDDPRSHP